MIDNNELDRLEEALLDCEINCNEGCPNCCKEIRQKAVDTIEQLFEMTHRLWTASDVVLPDEELAAYNARHPEEGGVIEVLVMVRDATEPTVLLYDGESFMDQNGERYKVDFWQPMPQPPKAVTG